MISPSRIDRAIFQTCLAGASFFLGAQWADHKPKPPAVCPVVQGAVVISTTNTPQGQHCTYQREAKGMISQRVKI